MFFTKYPHRSNFSFPKEFNIKTGGFQAGKRTFESDLTCFEGGVAHLRISHPSAWSGNKSLVSLNEPAVTAESPIRRTADGGLEVIDESGAVVLRTLPDAGIGVSGAASLFQFEVPESARFYGMGEKLYGEIELSGYRTRFWNTDVWSDFPAGQWIHGPADPPYFSTPYVAVDLGGTWVGLLLHNPYPAFIETPGIDDSRVFVEWQRTAEHLILGTDGGEPNLWVVVASSLKELTMRLQMLVGPTPVPPIWALGYHQSRWGYEGHAALLDLDRQFAKHEIPCDALWLDLDYMDGFRIFKTDQAMFPQGPVATKAGMKLDRRIVPILDPGVKKDPGYRVYDDGSQKDVFCKNTEGEQFVGLVWPGETVFPDFISEKGREWWTGYVKEFADEGFDATWCDMNDPSTGPVDPTDMLFLDGTEPHAAHRNQYALGMQMATFEGFLRARPNERPFILSRSGYTGSSRYCAIWSGDNLSNRFYLSNSIPCAIGLSLSGLPFTGPDLGGFGENCDDELMIDWIKAGFLFPFLRNHSQKYVRRQEPFAYPQPTLNIVRRYIRLRYKLMPYLYNLFAEHEATGEPILRPLLYEFESDETWRTSDQFMIGPFLMQAPLLEAAAKSRSAILPGDDPWYDARTGEWLPSGQVTLRNGKDSTPLFVRSGAMIPMQAGTPRDNTKELRSVAMHVFVPEGWSGETVVHYRADDGISYDYRRGVRSEMKLTMVAVDGNVAISTEMITAGFGPIEVGFVVHGGSRSVRVNGRQLPAANGTVVLSGKPLPVQVLG
jgi:alpha-glucosidase